MLLGETQKPAGKADPLAAGECSTAQLGLGTGLLARGVEMVQKTTDASAAALSAYICPGIIRKRPRQIATNACAACKRAKTKCSEERPCPRCIRAGASAACMGPPLSISLEKRNGPDAQTKQRRKSTAQSCASCRQSKVKCDDVKPCTRCIKNGWAGHCAGWRNGTIVSKDTTFRVRVHQPQILSAAYV